VPRWTLRLRPRVAPMTQVIERVEITGRDVVLETMTVVEVGGDETITTFSEVDAHRRFTPEELTRCSACRRGPRGARGSVGSRRWRAAIGFVLLAVLAAGVLAADGGHDRHHALPRR
jgi:hypothetical protein